MNTFGRRLELALKNKNMKNSVLAYRLNVDRSYITNYIKGKYVARPDTIEKMANILGVSAAWLSGFDVPMVEPKKEPLTNVTFMEQSHIRMIPLYESVSAGFGALAVDNIIDYIPVYIKDEIEATETLFVKVQGDSMYPTIEEGDFIQVHKQTSVDSGSIAVVLLDKEEAFVKRIVYGDEWIELHSINPMYKVMRFDGPDVLRLEIVGLVKRVMKDL